MTLGKLLFNAVCWVIGMSSLWLLSNLLCFNPAWILIGWYLWDDIKKESKP